MATASSRPLPLRAGSAEPPQGQGPWPGAQPQRTAVGHTDVEYFHPVKFRLEPDLLVTVLGGLVYSGDIVLAITGDKIDSGKITCWPSALEELKQFKHVEAPKEINLAVLRALFELLRPAVRPGPEGQPGRHRAGQANCRRKSAKLVPRVLKAGTDLQQGKLGFWGQNLLRDEEAATGAPGWIR
jgi:hypothetical protein